MDDTETLTARLLRADDLPDLMALVEEAGWNQTEADWTTMLRLGRGRGFADGEGRLVASSMTLAYGGRIGWIGMVLVAGAWRRRGLATAMIDRCIEYIAAKGLVPALDATPQGEKVYRKMGFSGEREIARWRRSDGATGHSAVTPDAMAETDLGWAGAIDARAFGADRRDLLASYLMADDRLGRSIGHDAFLLQRPGRTARHLGPLCATDEATALALAEFAIGQSNDPLLIDVPVQQKGLSDLLAAMGFVEERSFRRMYLGADAPMGEPSLQYAIAGPELG